ncbi:Hypothetical protein ATO13_07220 [Stappia sp. 22II-S9-Z10]|nr:Hypothetical protein ATO13_07220 [Stappia sp. 22II-S9-Z10]
MKRRPAPTRPARRATAGRPATRHQAVPLLTGLVAFAFFGACMSTATASAPGAATRAPSAHAGVTIAAADVTTVPPLQAEPWVVVADAGAPAQAAPNTPIGGETSVAEPAGFRSAPYRAPVPATLTGATVVTTETAATLYESGATFIDVLPVPPRPANLPAGTLWRTPPRSDIPGSIWLPNTGYDRLTDAMDAWYRARLDDAAEGDTASPLVFYCLADCWMSWNAAKRAVGYGYSNVHWYPQGTDGWAAAGHPLEPRTPQFPD